MCHNKMTNHRNLTMMSKHKINISNNSKQYGLTLIELIVVIIIVGVVSGIAIPSMNNVLENQRISAANNDLITSMVIARSEAVRQKKHVTVCASSNGTTCNTGSTGIANWSDGWIVFANSSSANLTRNTGSEPLINVVSAPKGISSITLSLSNGGAATLLSYRPNGSLGSVATNQAKLFTICDSRGASSASATLLNRTGRPKAHKTGFSDAALSCS